MCLKGLNFKQILYHFHGESSATINIKLPKMLSLFVLSLWIDLINAKKFDWQILKSSN